LELLRQLNIDNVVNKLTERDAGSARIHQNVSRLRRAAEEG